MNRGRFIVVVALCALLFSLAFELSQQVRSEFSRSQAFAAERIRVAVDGE